MKRKTHDMFKREYKVGDYLVFPVSVGHSGSMLVGQVVEITEKAFKIRAARECFNRVEARTRLSSLNYPERGMIIPRSAVPAEALALIDKVSA